MPHNLTDGDVRRIVRDVLRSQSSIGDYSPGSIPWTAIVSPRIAAPTLVPTLAELPTSGLVEGMPVIYDTGTAGVRWLLVYDTTDGTTYPWLYVGGPPLYDYDDTDRTVSGPTSYSTWSEAPSITVPLSGEYRVRIEGGPRSSSGGQIAYMACKIGAASAADANALVHYDASLIPWIGGTRTIPATVAAADALALYVKAGAGDVSTGLTSLSITPVRVGA